MKNRWVALTIIFVSFFQLTLNWFAVVPAFGAIASQMHLGLPQIGLIVGAFIGGYGLAHIPGGLIAEAYGMRFAMLLGIGLETAGAIVTAVAPDYPVLLLGRFVAGAGGSIYIGSAIGLTAAWFRKREIVTATSMVTGVAFTIGAAIALFGWGPLVADLGWRGALLCGAGIGAASFLFVTALFPTPPNAAGQVLGRHLDIAALTRVFAHADLWLLGLSFVGGYGAYFTAAQLLPEYAQSQHGLSAGAADQLGVILLLAGIAGSFLGGWLADKVFGVIPTFLGACILESFALVMLPFVGPVGLQICAAAIGGFAILAFVSWVSLPGVLSGRIAVADIPTAAGLMLTIAAVGGVGMPALYGHVVQDFGYKIGWLGCAALCFVLALVSLIAWRPRTQAGNRAVPGKAA